MSTPAREPQVSTGRWSLVGPGIVVAATGVGAIDLVATLIAGSKYEYGLMWCVVVGCIMKIVLVEGAGRPRDCFVLPQGLQRGVELVEVEVRGEGPHPGRVDREGGAVDHQVVVRAARTKRSSTRSWTPTRPAGRRSASSSSCARSRSRSARTSAP